MTELGCRVQVARSGTVSENPHAQGAIMQSDVLAQPKPEIFRSIAPWWHTAVILVVQGLLAYRGMIRADQMRAMINPDRVRIYERTILFEWLVLGLVILGVWLHGASILNVLGERWRSGKQVLRDAGIAVLFLAATIMVSSIAGGHGHGAEKAAQFILPRGGVELAFWVALSISAGICEEGVYRGYLQRQLMALTKSVPAGIILSAAAFGAAHSYLGLPQALVIGVLGVMSGVLAYWCKSVRPGMIAHALQDVLGGILRH
jgi:uncharacterized protein